MGTTVGVVCSLGVICLFSVDADPERDELPVVTSVQKEDDDLHEDQPLLRRTISSQVEVNFNTKRLFKVRRSFRLRIFWLNFNARTEPRLLADLCCDDVWNGCRIDVH